MKSVIPEKRNDKRGRAKRSGRDASDARDYSITGRSRPPTEISATYHEWTEEPQAGLSMPRHVLDRGRL